MDYSNYFHDYKITCCSGLNKCITIYGILHYLTTKGYYSILIKGGIEGKLLFILRNSITLLPKPTLSALLRCTLMGRGKNHNI